LKIERPNWRKLLQFYEKKTLCDCNGGPYTHIKSVCWEDLDDWFKVHVEPVNKMLAKGIVVYGGNNGRYWDDHTPKDDKFIHAFDYETEIEQEKTHSALLINIEQIHEAAEDVLRDLLKYIGDKKEYSNDEIDKLIKRAEKMSV